MLRSGRRPKPAIPDRRSLCHAPLRATHLRGSDPTRRRVSRLRPPENRDSWFCEIAFFIAFVFGEKFLPLSDLENPSGICGLLCYLSALKI